MSLAPGEFYIVRFNVPVPVVHHERLILAVVLGRVYVLTPDDDRYEESVVAGPDILSIHPIPHQGGTPLRINPAQVYRFRALPPSLVAFGVRATSTRSRPLSYSQAWTSRRRSGATKLSSSAHVQHA